MIAMVLGANSSMTSRWSAVQALTLPYSSFGSVNLRGFLRSLTQHSPSSAKLIKPFLDGVETKAVADPNQRRLFRKAQSMNYGAFSNDSLAMMYEAVRGALSADDAFENQRREPRFRVRETSEWKKHAADLEAEMLLRGMIFNVIDWHEGQAKLPFER